jgi:hypothetical protein
MARPNDSKLGITAHHSRLRVQMNTAKKKKITRRLTHEINTSDIRL